MPPNNAMEPAAPELSRDAPRLIAKRWADEVR
jgi:hypothetical protein